MWTDFQKISIYKDEVVFQPEVGSYWEKFKNGSKVMGESRNKEEAKDLKPLIVCGDIHGAFDVICKNASKLADSTVIQLGDFGLGFRPQGEEDILMETLNHNCKANNIDLLVIRGNHCQPCWHTNPIVNQTFNQKYSNITLIPDYYSKEINGKKCLFIGGAVSVDRKYRTEGKDWWPDEVVVPPRFSLTGHDIVFSHTAPEYFQVVENKTGDILDSLAKYDPKLKEDCAEERELMNHIHDQVRPSKWYFGHFHVHKTGDHEGCKWRCVDINEFVEVS